MGENADSSVMTLLQAQNETVIEHLDRLEAQLTDHLRANASNSRAAFDHLYDEMQAYKRNFLLEAQRPLLQDLMMLYDSIDKLHRNYKQAASMDLAALSQNLEGLQVEAEEILLRVGIERMTATSDKLDVNLQRAVKTVATENPEENLWVVEQVRCGFLSGGQPIRKEQVVVKKYVARAPGGSPSNPGELTGS
ncbi:MAG: nucleotide exchange factor GrpE [Candidatus Solibacter sp.]|nr:nucleotide exchange factor GrpE [Candidatus Solibacter sp.]